MAKFLTDKYSFNVHGKLFHNTPALYSMYDLSPFFETVVTNKSVLLRIL